MLHIPQWQARLGVARAASRAVWAVVAAEIAAGTVLALAVGLWLARTLQSLDPTSDPPWTVLPAAAAAGAATRVARLAHAGQVLHAWHSTWLRHLDERQLDQDFANEDDGEPPHDGPTDAPALSVRDQGNGAQTAESGDTDRGHEPGARQRPGAAPGPADGADDLEAATGRSGGAPGASDGPTEAADGDRSASAFADEVDRTREIPAPLGPLTSGDTERGQRPGGRDNRDTPGTPTPPLTSTNTPSRSVRDQEDSPPPTDSSDTDSGRDRRGRFVAGDEAERFWRQVHRFGIDDDLDDDGLCWVWVGGLDRDGYGRFTVTSSGVSRTVPAHRWSYQATYGPIPEGKEPDHLCNIRPCVRPDHLEAVTHRTNVRRIHQRRRRGQRAARQRGTGQ